MVFVEYYGEGSPIMTGAKPVPFIHGEISELGELFG